MRWSVIVLAACGRAHAPSDVLPACPPGPAWTAHVPRCQVDRTVGDLHVRVVADPATVQVSIEAAKLVIARNPAKAAHGAVVTLASIPREYARAVAAVLVGDDRVRCETGCAMPDGAAASFLDGSRAQVSSDLDGMYRYTPRWQPGAPAPAGLSAVVLDPLAVRPPRLLTLNGVELAGQTLAIVDAEAPLAPLATCAEYDVVGNDEAIAVVDRETNRWSWIEVDGARRPHGAVACAHGVVAIAHDALTTAIRPSTGMTVQLDDATFDELADHLAALLDEPRPLVACTDRAPLFTRPAHAPCLARGTDDGHGWSIAPRVAGDDVLAWRVELASEDPVVVGDRVFGPAKLSRAIAQRLVGSVGCITPRRDCGAPDPLVRWLFAAGLDKLLDDRGIVAPIWQAGAPAIPPPGIAMVPFDRFAHVDGETGLAYDLARGGPLKHAPCGKRTVWWNESAGAVADAARWSWMYVGARDPIAGGRCVGAIAVFDHPDGTATIVDPDDGAWITLDRAHLAGDPAALRAAIHAP